MRSKISAAAVHLLTASGAVCGLMAIRYAATHDWQAAFLWLGAAAIVDAIDGPIARFVKVGEILPRFSGETLDLVVDYLTYCVAPAFLLMESGRAGDVLAPAAGAMIVLSSLFHFADTRSKTDDGFFVGFPAIWNVVCLYFFVFDVGPAVVIPLVAMLSLATVLPIKWVHPLRSRRWRLPTLCVLAIWSLAALYEVVENFPGSTVVRILFVVSAVYLVGVGAARTFVWRGGRIGK